MPFQRKGGESYRFKSIDLSLKYHAFSTEKSLF